VKSAVVRRCLWVILGRSVDRSRLEVFPGVWLDHRRAVFIEEHGILAVADLHLGYAWAHRYNGQLLPLTKGDLLIERLQELCSSFQPQVIALLGDVIHEAVPVQEVARDVHQLLDLLSSVGLVRIVFGNHDKRLRSLLKGGFASDAGSNLRAGRFILTHGNENCAAAAEELVVMGHEHPAISLGDGVAAAKFPCFLVSKQLIVLPAFSLWASGTNIRSYPLMSHLARAASFSQAVAV
jgi:uncharacterized protein